MDNLRLYEQGREVPDEAKKSISAGRLKGKTDINPMWRIKKLTEMFGACGVGWWYDITNKQIVFDEITNQKAAFVDILLYYKDPLTDEVSHGIPGTGGASFVAKELNGAYMSDECFKMALTDAISVAAKALGIGADVYFDKDTTKYNRGQQAMQNPLKKPAAPPKQQGRTNTPAQPQNPTEAKPAVLTDAQRQVVIETMQTTFKGHPLRGQVFERLTGYSAKKLAEIPRDAYEQVIKAITLTEEQATAQIAEQMVINNAGATA